MNQTCKQLHLDWDMVMKHFTKLDGIRYRLPDIPNHKYFTGDLHIIDDVTPTIEDDEMRWFYRGKLHRENDLLAVIYGPFQWWYKHGKRYRDNDLPAYVDNNGSMIWYCNDKMHRDNGLPAYIDVVHNIHRWFINGHQVAKPNLY